MRIVPHPQSLSPKQWGMAGARWAFTLVELLVVIAIIALIAGLAVLLGPSLLKTERASRGAALLQGTLLIAKQQALRDQVPFGIRLIPDPADGLVRSFRYIHQPDDFTGNSIIVEATDPTGVSASPLTTALIFKDPTGGLVNPQEWPVQPGDYLQVQSEQPVRIVNIVPVNASSWRLYLGSAASQTPVFTSDYRIIRRPRPVAGEDIIDLPETVVIDLSGSTLTPDPTPPATLDIVFAAGEGVVGPASINGKIILWVRDTTQNPATSDDQSFIVVYTRSGRIAAFAVDIASGNRYSFIEQSARAAGQ